MNDHVCDRKGAPKRVTDESDDEPITYSTCSVCGKPQAFNARTQQLIAKLALLSAEDRELIARLVNRFASAQPVASEARSRAAMLIAYLKRRH